MEQFIVLAIEVIRLHNKRLAGFGSGEMNNRCWSRGRQCLLSKTKSRGHVGRCGGGDAEVSETTNKVVQGECDVVGSGSSKYSVLSNRLC